MVEAIFISNVDETPAKLGTFQWVDLHLKGLMIGFTTLGTAFVLLLLIYVKYLLGFASSDWSNQYLAITALVFAVTTLLSNIFGFIAIIKESENYLALFKYNNVCVTVLALVSSGVHFAKGAYVLKDITDRTGLATVFITTAVGYIFMTITYGALLYLLYRCSKLKHDATLHLNELKLSDAIGFTTKDLNSTQTGCQV
ncbi:putative membrane protein [Babesia divergens]|uniref:Membrane protein n=1 Tax=Babesia divergens TaxID=32595 RepID=A0AAD9G6W0_BABDI|nr:putative membrane protein [Babesia divergens]